MEKTEVLNIRVSPALKAAAVTAAKKDGRSLSGFIAKLLADHVAKAKSGGRL